jgi:two-component system sensor histidine kinase UhpB
MFQRLAALNALVLLAAVVLTVVVLDPHRFSGPKLDEEAGVLAGALVLVVLVNLLLLERVIRPLRALSAFARKVDLSRPHARMPSTSATSEVAELAATLNEMLERLEAERRSATGRVLAGQEAERLRIAQELHDQVGQDLTAVLLSLARISSRAPEVAVPVSEAQDAVRASLEDVRQIALELRPEALDDLGLASALAVLCDRVAERSGLAVERQISEPLPSISPEDELVIYRIAQEALTNVARHSGSDSAKLALTLDRDRDRLTLTVRDCGVGLSAAFQAGGGIRGMQERAALVGAQLEIGANPSGRGSEVRLVMPLTRSS